MVTIRNKLAGALVFLAVLVVAGPVAVDAQSRQPESRGEVVRFGTPVRIGPDERVEGNLVVFGAPVRVFGEVTGDAVAIGGPLTINGEVRQNVVAIGGPLRLGERAVVGGDIVTIGGRLRRAAGASVEGAVVDMADIDLDLSGLRPDIWPFESSRGRMARTWDLVGTLVRIIFLALVAAIALLAMRGTVERVANRASAEPLKSGLVGLLAQMLFVPLSILTVILLVISIIGIPLLLLAPFVILALVCVSIIGFSGAALGVGHAARSRMGALGPATYMTIWAGIVLLVMPTILGETLEVAGGLFRAFGLMFLLFGVLVEYAAWTTGLGALILNGMNAPFSRRPTPASPPEQPPAGPDPRI